MNRKKVTFFLFLIFTLSLTLIYSNQIEKDNLKKSREIHEKVLTIDTHVDTPFMLSREGYDISQSHDAHKGEGRVDFPRMKEGGLDGIFFAVFLGQGPRTPEKYKSAQFRALKLIALIHTSVKKHPNLAELALSSDDAYRIEDKGKRAIYIGMENGYPLGLDLSMVKKYYDLGVRYITLCHTRNNQICDSSTDDPEEGLTGFGKKVVKEMNRLGMLIDVSHLSDQSFYDVLKVSKAPVIASHSCSRAVCDNPRNLSDDMLKKLKENNGVIQMCILSEYVKKPKPYPERDAAFKALRKKYNNFKNITEKQKQQAWKEWDSINDKFPRELARVSDVVDHIDHMVNVIGIDHVGIGTDFDGGGGIEDCYDVSEMGNITIELVKRGYTEEQIRKIWGGNFIRVFREVERIPLNHL
jgi:membrane dipeptidase